MHWTELVRFIVEMAVIPAAVYLYKQHVKGSDRREKLATMAQSIWQQVEVLAEKENLFDGQKWFRWVQMLNSQLKQQGMKPATGPEMIIMKAIIDGLSAKDKMMRMNGKRREVR